MGGHENEVELMGTYPIPQSIEDIHKYSFLGYMIFGSFLIAVIALALYFA